MIMAGMSMTRIGRWQRYSRILRIGWGGLRIRRHIVSCSSICGRCWRGGPGAQEWSFKRGGKSWTLWGVFEGTAWQPARNIRARSRRWSSNGLAPLRFGSSSPLLLDSSRLCSARFCKVIAPIGAQWSAYSLVRSSLRRSRPERPDPS